MAEVFVSYAREDRDWVARFSRVLCSSTGWQVWWDRSILPGERFDEAIEKAMGEAACVVVVWSRHSIGSRWVRAEAREACRREVLVPVRIESVILPLEFSSFETQDLTAWRGEPDNEEFLELAETVRTMISHPGASGSNTPKQAPAVRGQLARPVKRRLQYMAIAIFAALVLIGGAAITALGRKATPALPPSTESQQALTSKPPPTALSPGLPHLAYGTWTLRNAVDEQGNDWSNSALKFTSQKQTPDGLQLRGTFTWRLRNVLIGTEEFEGDYIAKTRQLFFEGTAVKDMPGFKERVLAIGSYSATVSPDETTLVNGRWGVTQLKDEAGYAGRWEAVR